MAYAQCACVYEQPEMVIGLQGVEWPAMCWLSYFERAQPQASACFNFYGALPNGNAVYIRGHGDKLCQEVGHSFAWESAIRRVMPGCTVATKGPSFTPFPPDDPRLEPEDETFESDVRPQPDTPRPEPSATFTPDVPKSDFRDLATGCS